MDAHEPDKPAAARRGSPPRRCAGEPETGPEGPPDAGDGTHPIDLLADAVASADDAIIVLAPDGSIRHWNAGAEHLYGYTAEEVIGRPITLLCRPERAGEMPRILDRVGCGQVVRQIEDVRVRKNGHEVDVALTVCPIRDASGRVVAASAIARDNSPLKWAVMALRKSETLTQALFALGPTGMAQIEPASGRLLRVNDRFCYTTGYTAGELSDMTFRQLVPPEDRQTGLAGLLWTGVGQETAYFGEARLVKKDGALITLQIDAAILKDAAGATQSIVAIFRDLPAPLRDEASHRSLTRAVVNQSKVLRAESRALVLRSQAIAAGHRDQSPRERLRQHEAVARLGLHALREDDVQCLMDEAVALVAQTLGVGFVKILEHLPGGDRLHLRAGVGWREGLVGRASVGASFESQAGYTLYVGAPVVVEDLDLETRFTGPPLLREHGVVSGISCPIAAGPGDVFGVLGAHTAQRRVFARDDIDFLQAVANVLGSALQRARAKAALGESEQFLRKVLDSLQVFVAVLTPDGTVVKVNSAALSAASLRSEDVVGKPFEQAYWWSFSPEVQARLRTAIVDAARGRASRYDVPIRLAEDRYITIDFQLVPMTDAQGRVTHLIPSAIDVTARQEAEQRLRESRDRLRAIVETADDAIITIDGRGTIESFNRAAERIFGYAAGEVIGRNVKLLIPPPLHDEHDEDHPSQVHTGKRRIIGNGREVVGRRRDGSTFPIELSVSEIDHLDVFVALLRDISERRRLEKEILDVAAEEQRRIGQELHDSTGQVLTGVSLMAQVLADRLAAESPAEHAVATRIVEGIGQALDQLRAIVRGLVPVEVDADSLMAALGELAADVSVLHGVVCRFECPKPVAVRNQNTAMHLFRIAREAVTNALKHAQPSRIRISLEGRGDEVTLTIRDNGRGLPAALDEYRGSGLRLMRYRAGLIGGRLTTGRAAGGGTLIRCTYSEAAHHG